jgi:hypothetical protein
LFKLIVFPKLTPPLMLLLYRISLAFGDERSSTQATYTLSLDTTPEEAVTTTDLRYSPALLLRLIVLSKLLPPSILLAKNMSPGYVHAKPHILHFFHVQLTGGVFTPSGFFPSLIGFSKLAPPSILLTKKIPCWLNDCHAI